MTMNEDERVELGGLSRAGRARLISDERGGLLRADWRRVLFVHFAVPESELRLLVPFPLDLWEDEAVVSVVAFDMCGLHFRSGTAITRWMTRYVGTHELLNVRT